MNILNLIGDCIIKGDNIKIIKYIEQALKTNNSAINILNNGLIPGMNEISRKFKRNEIYVPEVLIAASVMHTGMDILRPLLAKSTYRSSTTVIIGTVKSDLHDIGKKMVSIMFEGAGFRVIDLGVDVSPEHFIEKANEHSADVIAISALLTTTMQMMKLTVEKIQSTDLKNKVKIIVGGAPVTLHFAKLIHADGYAEDAARAVDVVKQLLDR